MSFAILDGRGARRPSHLFGRVLDRWLAFRARSWGRERERSVRSLASRWRRVLGERPLRSLKPHDVLGLYEDLDRGALAAATLNGHRKLFKSFWVWAGAMEMLSRPFPEAAWPRKPRSFKRSRECYTQREEEGVLAHLAFEHARYATFATASGFRFGETVLILWSWIEDEPHGSSISIPAWARKQGQPLRVPLSRRARDVLGERGEAGAAVFPGLKRDTVNRALKRAAERSGLGKPISVHQLRRTCIGRLQRSGVSSSLIRFLVGSVSQEVIDEHYTAPLGLAEARSYLDRI